MKRPIRRDATTFAEYRRCWFSKTDKWWNRSWEPCPRSRLLRRWTATSGKSKIKDDEGVPLDELRHALFFASGSSLSPKDVRVARTKNGRPLLLLRSTLRAGYQQGPPVTAYARARSRSI